MSSNNNNTLFLVGGTGKLGLEIAKGLVTAAGFDQHVALVRAASSKDSNSTLEQLGWTVMATDFDDAAALTTSLAGAKVVVSTVGGLDLEAAERQVMDASKSVGASLFVPSQYGIDYRRWKDDFPFMTMKKRVLEHAEQIGLATLSVFVGSFTDVNFFFLANVPDMTATLVDGGTTKFSFIKRSDIGYVLAKALADPKYASGGYLSMEGDNMTWAQALALIESVTGKQFTKTEMTGEEALVQEKALMEKGDVGSFFGAFALHLLGTAARGSTGFDVSAESETYDVKMETVEETVKAMFATSA